MSARLLAALTVALLPAAAEAAIPPPPFNPETNTWYATHIVAVESGKVVESWKGDLKVGDALPEGADRFAKLPTPPFAPEKGLAPPRVDLKRRVIFLAHVVKEGDEEKKLTWMGACHAGHPADPVAPSSVAWVEGDRMFLAEGDDRGRYTLYEDRTGLPGLKRRVEVGIKLRAKFEDAKADPNLEKRAERLVALVPEVTMYHRGWGTASECVWALSECGAAGVPHLVKWANQDGSERAQTALYALCRIGDAAADEVVKILDDEAAYWKAVAENLKPGQSVREAATPVGRRYRNPIQFYHVIQATLGMKLSPANAKRVQTHAGLAEVDKILETTPAMKPANSDMVTAHKLLKDLLAGKFQ